MAFTVSQLTALEAAIASGHKRVSYDGKTVEYQSTDDMVKAAGIIRADLIANGLLSEGTNPRGRSTVAEFTRE